MNALLAAVAAPLAPLVPAPQALFGIDTGTAIWITVVLLLVLLMLRFPIGFALGIAGAVGIMIVRDPNVAVGTMVNQTFTSVYTTSLTIIPMFLLMGLFMVRARVAEYALEIAAFFFKRLPGGLGVATIVAAAGFSAVSGSSIAKVATMTKLAVPEMRRHGYPAALATGMVTVAGTVGILIPPSTFVVLYAVITGTPMGPMLVAGLVPVAISFLAYIIYIMTLGARRIGKSKRVEDAEFIATFREVQAEVHANAQRKQSKLGLRRRGQAITPAPAQLEAKQQYLRHLPWRGLVYIVIIVVVVLGGFLLGFYTPTESAGWGATVAVIILFIERGLFERGKNRAKNLFLHVRDSLLDTAAVTSMIFFIVIGGIIFAQFFSLSGVTQGIQRAVEGWVQPGDPPILAYLVIALLLFIHIPLGMFLEEMSLLYLYVPIILPIGLNFAEIFFPLAPTTRGAEVLMSIWLGVMIIKLTELGMVMPPLGINSFVAAGTAKLKPTVVFRGIMPFMIIDFIILVILFLFPVLSLWLPSFVSTEVSGALFPVSP
jgi:TRAP-type C4-dicarboxylate transport system permease large subunit